MSLTLSLCLYLIQIVFRLICLRRLVSPHKFIKFSVSFRFVFGFVDEMRWDESLSAAASNALRRRSLFHWLSTLYGLHTDRIGFVSFVVPLAVLYALTNYFIKYELRIGLFVEHSHNDEMNNSSCLVTTRKIYLF